MRLVRKNLIVDADAVAALAAARGTSESDAVRYAVAQALSAEETVDALAKLHQFGAWADAAVTHRMYGAVPTIDPKSLRVRAAESRRRRPGGRVEP